MFTHRKKDKSGEHHSMNEDKKENGKQNDIESKTVENKNEISEIQENIKKTSDNPKNQTIIIIVLLIFLALIIAVAATSFYGGNRVSKESELIDNNVSVDVRINEYVISNENTFRDGQWNSPDWIELYNYGNEPASLGAFYLSDEEDEPTKFKLPDVTLMPGEYILVLASGKTDIDDGNIRAPFQLSSDDKSILLSTEKQIINTINIEDLPTDISSGYTEDSNMVFFAEPTPGGENTTKAYGEKDIEPVNGISEIIIINEYLSSNNYSITDSEGEHNDWIELYNPNDYAVFIGDMYLSDDENETNKFKLPDVEIPAHDYLLVYASDKVSVSTEYIYAPFKISSNDNKLILVYKNGSVISECDVYDLPADVSAGMSTEGVFGFFAQPTPSSVNSTEISSTFDIEAGYSVEENPKVLINEWMPNNQFGILDANGDASDWIELYNTSDIDIYLVGYSLSDNIEDLKKWMFPADAIIPANGYIVIFTSGKNEILGDEFHTNFALDETETLYLVNDDCKVAGIVEMEYMPGNVSKGVVDEGYGYFYLPTPGKENNSVYSNELKANVDFVHTDVYISEVASSDIHLSRYKGKYTYEYIEIYNSGNEIVDLSGYTLYEGEDSYFTLQNASIKPRGYLLISVKGYIPSGVVAIQADNISLNSSGESILLKNSDGITIDYFETGYLLGDYSSGRVEGDADTRVFFIEKTPGELNSSDIYYSYSSKPVFSEDGGEKEEEVYLSIYAEDGATIYYTVNGSMPNKESNVYTEAVLISMNTVVRAISVLPNKLPSLCTTRTFILEKEHDLPIICISAATGGLFYDNGGIYANGPGYGKGPYPYFESNYFMDVEREIAFEYYESNNEIALAFDCGLQIAGGYSRANEQKSLAIRLRDEYGLSEVAYPFFESGTNTFQHLFIRNGGQDGLITMMRDSFIQNCAITLGTVDCKRGEPVVVYINGEYWGLYNLRDKINADYFKTKYGYDDDVVINIITEYSAAKSGTADDWLNLKSFCQSNDFSIDENYYILAERVDVQAFMDHIIMQTFFGNADTHNINFWKAEVEGSKWKPILYDLDLSIFDLGYSMVADYLNEYTGYHDHILDALKQSDIFIDAFLQRYSYLICEVFTEEYLLNEIEADYNAISEEMKNHVEIYSSPSTYTRWESNVENLRTYMIKRRNDIVDELQNYFNLSDEEITELFPYSVDN